MSIGTLSQIFKNHIVTVAFKGCVPSASDVFLSKNITMAGKPARLTKWWNMIFISRNMIFVLCDHVF